MTSTIVRIPFKALVTGAALCAVSAGAAWAADQPKAQQNPAQATTAAGESGHGLKGQDKTFFEKAAQGGMAEVEFAKLAVDRASKEEVKYFAATLQREHTNANERLMRIALQNGWDAPKQISAEQRKTLEKLSKLKGDAFDQAFMQEAGMKDHTKDIELFEKQAKDGKEPQLIAFAEETLPTLKSHLQMAKKIGGGAHGAQSGDPVGDGNAASSSAHAQERPAAARQQ